MTLPAISLFDPYAGWVAAGRKTLETRKSAVLSGFTGPIVIHRSAKPCQPYDVARWGPPASRPEGWPEDDRGMAIGIVMVGRTWRMRPEGLFDAAHEDFAEVRRQACYDDIAGRYMSPLTCATWLARPVKASGSLGRWKIDLPDELVPEWAR